MYNRQDFLFEGIYLIAFTFIAFMNLSPKFLKWSFAIAILVFILYQIDKNARMDDDLIGEQLYFLLKEGTVRSEMLHGYGGLQLEVSQTIFHKGFIYVAYAFTSLFGWSLYSLHLFALLIFLLLCILLWRGFPNLAPDFRPEQRSFFFCLLLINYNTLYFASAFRPEFMLALWGFLGYWFLLRYLRQNKIFLLFLASVAGGFAFATHPHGLIFPAAGFVLLAAYKRWKALSLYTLIVSITFAVVYFADIFRNGSYDLFLYQVTHDPLIQLHDKGLMAFLLNIADEHVRWFFNEREITITLLFVGSLIFSFRQIAARNKPLLIYLFSLMALLGLISYSNSPQYVTLYMPYQVAVITLGWSGFRERFTSKYKNGVWCTLLAAFVSVHFVFAFVHIKDNIADIAKSSLAVSNNGIAAKIPFPHNTKSVLAQGNFIFDEIKNFKSVQTLTMYSFFREQQNLPKLSLSELLQSATKNNVDYIVMSDNYRKYFEVSDSLVKLYRASVTMPKIIHHEQNVTIFALK